MYFNMAGPTARDRPLTSTPPPAQAAQELLRSAWEQKAKRGERNISQSWQHVSSRFLTAFSPPDKALMTYVLPVIFHLSTNPRVMSKVSYMITNPPSFLGAARSSGAALIS